MKLLIITQRIDKNDPILGFFVRWVAEFAKHCEQVTVIALGVGEYNLPKNVHVLSLGKEDVKCATLRSSGAERKSGERSFIARLRYTTRFYHHIFRERKNYDTVFVHMNPVYIVLGGILWRALGKRIGLWYVHRSVDLKLRITEKLTHHIFTASKESFRLPSRKLHIVGHGIDMKQFEKRSVKVRRKKWDSVEILHIGRITPIKNIDILIRASLILKEHSDVPLRVTLVGEPVTGTDYDYGKRIKVDIKKYGLENVVYFIGRVKYSDLPPFYHRADLTVNLTPTGGVDKSVLESMVAGTPVFSSNEAFREYFGIYADMLLFKQRDPKDLAQKISHFLEMADSSHIGEYLATQAKSRASIEALIATVIRTVGVV